MQAGFGNVVVDPTAAIAPFEGFGQDIDVQELGAVDIENQAVVPGSMGLGIHAIEPGYRVGLGQDEAQLVGPPQLANAGDYGLGSNPGVAQANALGGPPISGLSMHYGATLFGSQ
jgi:hypothetical protein